MMEIYQVTGQDIKDALVNLTQVTFEITDACNLKCTYCCYGDLYEGYDQRRNGFLSFSQIKQTLDYLSDLWRNENVKLLNQKTYISFYGGEPLLNMSVIKETIDYVETQNYRQYRDIVFSMTTNAVLLDKYMDYLVEKNIYLLVSMDGDEKGQSYRVDYAGHNSFNKVFHNLKQLQTNYPAYFEQCVMFNSVLHARNGVVEIVSFLQKEFNKTPNISQLSEDDVRCDKRNEFACMQINYGENLHNSGVNDQLIKELSIPDPDEEGLTSFIERYSGNHFKNYNYLIVDDKKVRQMYTGTCFPFAKKVFITVNGKIMPCERISQDYYYGYVTDTSFDLDFQEVADKFNTWMAKLKPVCSLCLRNKICGECAFQNKSLNKDKAECPSFMGERAYKNYINNNLYFLSQHRSLYKKICCKQSEGL